MIISENIFRHYGALRRDFSINFVTSDEASLFCLKIMEKDQQTFYSALCHLDTVGASLEVFFLSWYCSVFKVRMSQAAMKSKLLSLRNQQALVLWYVYDIVFQLQSNDRRPASLYLSFWSIFYYLVLFAEVKKKLSNRHAWSLTCWYPCNFR